jgi:hypothetical protein
MRDPEEVVELLFEMQLDYAERMAKLVAELLRLYVKRRSFLDKNA